MGWVVRAVDTLAGFVDLDSSDASATGAGVHHFRIGEGTTRTLQFVVVGFPFSIDSHARTMTQTLIRIVVKSGAGIQSS